MRNLTAALMMTALAFGAPSLAQQSGLVNVNIANVANDLAKNLKIDISNNRE